MDPPPSPSAKTDSLLQATALHLATAASLRDTSGGYFAGDGVGLDFDSDAYRRQSAAAVAAAAAAPFDDEPISIQECQWQRRIQETRSFLLK